MDPKDTKENSAQLSAVSRRRLLVDGYVQGVGYRVSCARRARGAGLTGWVRNLGDGRVEVVLQGPPDVVGEIEAWCSRGPQMAVVTSVEASDEAPVAENGFNVR
jgi:acylphosphatase